MRRNYYSLTMNKTTTNTKKQPQQFEQEQLYPMRQKLKQQIQKAKPLKQNNGTSHCHKRLNNSFEDTQLQFENKERTKQKLKKQIEINQIKKFSIVSNKEDFINILNTYDRLTSSSPSYLDEKTSSTSLDQIIERNTQLILNSKKPWRNHYKQ